MYTVADGKSYAYCGNAAMQGVAERKGLGVCGETPGIGVDGVRGGGWERRGAAGRRACVRGHDGGPTRRRGGDSSKNRAARFPQLCVIPPPVARPEGRPR